MRDTRTNRVVEELDSLIKRGSFTGLDDESLLTRFREHRDPGAFAAIVERHGPLVLGVCRDILPDVHDVEDAFQATFLVLIRKSPSIRRPGALASWLHGVSRRVAVRIRLRRRTIRLVADVAAEDAPCPAEAREEARIVHEEIVRLPDRYRLPVVLFYLEGLTHEETAARLRWPVGTVRGRLARARERLRGKLDRRGVNAGWIGPGALSWPSPHTMVESRQLFEAASALACTTAASRISLIARKVIHTMFFEKFRFAFAFVATAAALTVGASVVKGFGGQSRDGVARGAAGVAVSTRPEQLAPSTSKADPAARAEERRERAEEELDQKKVRAEMLELEVESLRERLRALSKQESMLQGLPGSMAGRPVPEKAVEIYTQARDRMKENFEETRRRLEVGSLELVGLKRQIARDSRALGLGQGATSDSSPSIENRLRSLEQKVDRILEAIERSVR